MVCKLLLPKTVFRCSSSLTVLRSQDHTRSYKVWVQLIFSHLNFQILYGFLTKWHDIKIAGYWPSTFFASWSTNLQKEEGWYTAILTKQAWSIKDTFFIYGFGRNWPCRAEQLLVVPTGKRALPCSLTLLLVQTSGSSWRVIELSKLIINYVIEK